MKYPRQSVGSVQSSTILRDDTTDREIEAALDKIVHDSPFNFRSSDEGDKTIDQMRRGVPRHEW